jgi:hypothetical protein
MIAPSLHADLLARGVKVSIAPTPKDSPELPLLRLRVQAPECALTPSLKDAIRRHRDELLAYVFAVEERAAVIEYDGGHAREDAERLARGGANADGRLYLRDLAEHHPAVLHLMNCFKGKGEGEAELIEVRRDEAA